MPKSAQTGVVKPLRLEGAAQLQQLLEQLFEGLTDEPFFIKDAKLRYISANQAMARFCGVRSPAQVVGRRARDFFPRDVSDRYETFDRQVLTSGSPITSRFDLRLGAGRPVWLIFTKAPVRNTRGEVVGVAASARRYRSDARSDPLLRRIERVAQKIESSFAEPLRLAELANLAGVSISQLERDFVRLLGTTPLAVLNKARISHALRLLETGNTISAIAHECGYTDHSAFSRSFREAIGLSPRAYRSLLSQSSAEG